MSVSVRNLQLIVSTMDQGEGGSRRGARRYVAALIMVCLGLGIVMGFVGVAAVVLWRTWESTDWSLFWGATFILPVFIAMPGVGLLAARRYLARLSPAAAVLREAAASGDERVAPLAARQPIPAAVDAAAANMVAFGPLRRLGITQTALIAPVATIFLLVVFGSSFVAGTLNTAAGSSAGEAVFIYLPLFAFVLAGVFVALFLRWRSGRAFSVTASRGELSWRGGWLRPRRRLALEQARAFFQVTTTAPVTLVQSTTYVVDTAGGALIWTDRHDATDEEFEASVHLRGYVVARTGLPLRDLSTLAADLGQAGGQVRRALSGRLGLSGGAEDTPLIQRLVTAAAQARRARRGWRVRAGAIASMIVVLFGGLYGVGGWLQAQQGVYFAGLAPQVEAQTRLYSNSLAYDDGTWPTLAAQNGAGMIGFDGGAYHVTGTSRIPAYAGPALSFGDAAVEVTAQESGKRPDGTPDGVGLILRVSAHPADMVVFVVRATGRWGLYHYSPDTTPQVPWHQLVGGASSAIRTADGAPNRLLVVMRGRVYLCYINGRFVGSYFDALGATPGWGTVGTYNDNGGLDASFSDFAVYPVRPSSSLSTLFV